MRTIATTLAAMLAVALAASAFAQETTIQVPQGSGVLPTIGQVNCLEELGSGRLCAATYECSGESGSLWGDLANHNGRRAIGKDSPVARGRDCVITVDGRAAVRWLTAYSPGGRTGELVGLTTSEDALRPVQRVERQTGEGGGRLIDYILERYDVTITQYVEEQCGHIRQGHVDHRDCVETHLAIFVPAMNFPVNAFTRCMVEAVARTHERIQQTDEFPIAGPLAYTIGRAVQEYHVGSEDNRQCVPQAQEILADYGLEYYEVGGGFGIRHRE